MATTSMPWQEQACNPDCECKCQYCFNGKHCHSTKCETLINPATTVIEIKPDTFKNIEFKVNVKTENDGHELWCDGGIYKYTNECMYCGATVLIAGKTCECICHQKDYKMGHDTQCCANMNGYIDRANDIISERNRIVNKITKDMIDDNMSETLKQINKKNTIKFVIIPMLHWLSL